MSPDQKFASDVLFMERCADLGTLFGSGLTLEQLGERWGVSRERARQVAIKAGFSRDDYGPPLKCEQGAWYYPEDIFYESRPDRMPPWPNDNCSSWP